MFAEKIPTEVGMPSGSEPSRTFAGQTMSPSAPIALMPNCSFAARFCVHQGIPFEEFDEKVFTTCLYPAARQLRNLLSLNRDHFAIDYEFVASVGRVTTIRDLDEVVRDFSDNGLNGGLLRGALKLRVSARKLRRIAREYLHNRRAGDPVVDFATNGNIPEPASSLPAFTSSPTPPLSGERRSGSRGGPPPTPSGPPSKKPANETVQTLQQEVARLTEQRDVLKKTVGIFCEAPSVREFH
jgi:hypothetical protein